MSKTKEEYLNLFKGLQQVKVLKQELKHKYLQICSKNYNDRDLIIDCMYNNLKNENREMNNFLIKLDAHARFYEANKQQLQEEELKAQLLCTKKLVEEYKEWYDKLKLEQH